MSIDWTSRAARLKPRVNNFIEGRWQSDTRGIAIEKFSPRDGQLLYGFAAGGQAEVERAVAAAKGAFADGRWSKLTPERRKEALYRLAGLLEHRRDEFALLECLDVGKPIRGALEFDVPYCVSRLRATAEGAEHLYGKVYGVDGSNLSYQLRRPVGVVGAITGWNFPLVLAVEKIAPALVMGNCLVLKPSELTSLSSARLAELAIEAGVPEGVLNVVHGGPAAGEALAKHHDVDLLTFTGSSRTGKALLIAAGQSNMKRLLLECGGKAPNIVFDDSPNLEAVADAVVARAFWNQGEVCTASSRVLIHEGIHDEFLRLLIRKVSALRPGDPLDPGTTFGALVSRGHAQKVREYVGCGKDEGARVVYESDARAPNESGFYVPPVIFDDVSQHSRIAREEIFGPVLCVMRFRDEEEAIQIANGTIYGLSAILWTRDLGRAQRLTCAIDAGWIVVNATHLPTGGPGAGVLATGGHKESGVGVEGGIEGLEAYTRSTAVQLFV